VAASGTRYEETRLTVLDGLRGVAVLLVLWYHVWEISWLPAPYPWLEFVPETGFIGVHLFFFLSGFVITYPFIRARLRNANAPTWRHFAWRRFIKIVPSYVLAIALAYAIGYAQRQDSTPAWQAIATHLLFVHTWFPATYGSINGVLWTLAIEVEFYVLFPLTWWCFARAPWVTAAGMIAVSMLWRAGFAACCYSTLFAPYSENLPGYLGIFACGMLAAWIFCRYDGRVVQSHRYLAPLLLFAGTAALVALLHGLYAYRHEDQWASVWQIWRREWFGAAFAAIALGALWSPRGWYALLANRPLVFLGAISYNLYLYHQMLARELLWNRVPGYAGSPHADPHWQVLYTLVAFAASIALATLITYLFERPLLRLPDPLRSGALSGAWRNAVKR
jgi:peptidoglycan/LPS O-acetylase OafA/YrhL